MNTTFKNFTPVKKKWIETCAKLFTETFHVDPFIAYVFPDEEERRTKSLHYWRLMLQYAHLYGEVYTPSQEIEGVAAWVPSNKLTFNLWRVIRSGNYKLPRLLGMPAFKRLNRCVAAVMSIQKQKAPPEFMYLNGLCVSPGYQGKGYSNLLLNQMLERFDHEKRPCYLETQKEHIVAFYERLGFQIIDRSYIPQTDIQSWAMLR